MFDYNKDKWSFKNIVNCLSFDNKEDLLNYYGQWVHKIEYSGIETGGGCMSFEKECVFIFKPYILN